MKNSIADRIHDFLKEFPPFDLLKSDKLQTVANQVKIIYLEKGKTVFNIGDEYHDNFYVVRNGSIALYQNKRKNRELIDICDGGDMFGLRPLIIKEKYQLEATAYEESIIYSIPIEVFKSVADKNSKINKYLMIAFASNTFDSYSSEITGNVFGDYIPNNNQDIANLQTAQYSKNPITCREEATLQEAAIVMSENKIGCIIVVDSNKYPVGIITNSDIKNKIATGKFPIDTSVKNIMSSPVVTFPPDITVDNVQLQMIKRDIGHICITKDGTINSKVRGVLTYHDVLVSIGNNPSALLKEIKRAKRSKKLREVRNKANSLLKRYLDQKIPIYHIVRIISEINDAVNKRVVELSIKKMSTPPPCKFSWLSIGSQGRGEQLLYTDQDNAILFEDVAQDKLEETRAYFLELARHATKSLNKIGFEYCPAEMMASNANWCLSLTEWKNQFKEWIMNPNEKAILLSQVFFDFSCPYGDEELPKLLTDSIYNDLDNTSIFFSVLSKDALKSASPLGFFKQFIVEENGDHKDQFNLKNRALMPLVDAARFLILTKRVRGINNTSKRFLELAKIEPQNQELYKSCAYAYEALLKFRTTQGLTHNDSGKFIELSELTKEEKAKLKRSFKPIREIQELIQNRLNMANFK